LYNNNSNNALQNSSLNSAAKSGVTDAQLALANEFLSVIDPELLEIIVAWPALSEETRLAVLVLVRG
jgi:hypothetical protein